MGLTKVKNIVTDIDSDVVTYTSSVERTLTSKLGEFVSAKDFGAVGDGITDDTNAILDLIDYVNANTDVTKMDFSNGEYLIDFTNPRLLEGRVFAVIDRDNLTITGGLFKAKTGTYTSGVANGAWKVYVLFYIKGNYCTVDNVKFDVNNQSTAYDYSPSLPNVEFRHTYLHSGTNGVYRIGNNITNNKYLNGRGQTFVGKNQEQGYMAGNHVTGSLGMGWDSSRDCVLSGNTSLDAGDAHFGTWMSSRITLTGNHGYGNTNGNGMDIGSATDITITGNVLKDNQNSGIWVGKDQNSSDSSQGILISGNTLSNNQLYSSGSEAEIRVANLIGDVRAGITATDVVITGNRLIASARGVYIANLANNVVITDNSIEPSGAEFTQPRIDVSTTGKVVIRGNSTLKNRSYSDAAQLANSTVFLEDQIIGNYIKCFNGSVLAGYAGKYNDVIALNSTPRLVGTVKMTNEFDQGTIKVKVTVGGDDKINYHEKEFIFYGGITATPVADATTRVFQGTTASTGWVSLITATPAAGGLIGFYVETTQPIIGWVTFEVVVEYVEFYKAYNQ
jgi:hypothetical protein